MIGQAEHGSAPEGVQGPSGAGRLICCVRQWEKRRLRLAVADTSLVTPPPGDNTCWQAGPKEIGKRVRKSVGWQACGLLRACRWRAENSGTCGGWAIHVAARHDVLVAGQGDRCDGKICRDRPVWHKGHGRFEGPPKVYRKCGFPCVESSPGGRTSVPGESCRALRPRLEFGV